MCWSGTWAWWWQNDDYEKLKALDKEYDYIALKVPSSRTDLTWMVSELSYCFVEDMMFFEHDLHEIKRTPLQQRLYDAVEVSEMEDKDFGLLFKEIDAGSFSFDRISNDPYFSKRHQSKDFTIG